MTGALLAGALLGLGVAMMVAAFVPSAPDLNAALARLTAPPVITVEAESESGLTAAWGHATAWIAERMGLDRYRSDLALVGATPAGLASQKLSLAILGLAFPMVLNQAVLLIGVSVPFVVPAIASIGFAVGLSFMPELDLRIQATRTRVQMRRTVCTYLELVALERAADAGPVEALERAAEIGQGRGFELLRDALLRARIDGRQPWYELADLATELDVAELQDVADIMRLSGESGTSVLPTLRSRAASLRITLLQSEVTAANAASERMSMPVALMALAFMVLVGFPSLSRILFG